MRKLWLPLSILLLFGLIPGSCASGVSTPAPAVKLATPAPRAPWQQKWEISVAEAKKEGSVSIYTLWRPATRTALTQAFKEKYGIDLEFSPFSRGAELVARVQAEQRAGLFQADAFGAGAPSMLTILKPEGLLGPIEPLLIIPEVLDSNAWLGGKLPFQDKDRSALSMIAVLIPTVLYNTNLVREGEITSHKDLLKPQYKGKITLNDPSVTGAGPGLIAHLGENLWGEAETVDFLRRLLKEQEAVIQRDNRIHAESVALGKYAIALAPLPDLVAQLTSQGAPLKVAPLKEDNRTTAAAGLLGVPKRFAHPNAATVFVNWLLTREAQSVFAKSFGNPSIRVDASTEGVDPIFIAKPGEKIYTETEEFVAAMTKWQGLAKKIMDEAIK